MGNTCRPNREPVAQQSVYWLSEFQEPYRTLAWRKFFKVKVVYQQRRPEAPFFKAA